MTAAACIYLIIATVTFRINNFIHNDIMLSIVCFLARYTAIACVSCRENAESSIDWKWLHLQEQHG